MRTTLKLALASAALLIAAPAFAGGACTNCYRREVSPPVYRTVHQTVQVRPAQVVAHRIPAQFGVVHETVQIRPAQVVAHRIPAQFGVVHETVQVAPATQGWTKKYDRHGREILCQVTTPARYATVARTVMTRPEGVVHQTIPAQYGAVARTVMTRPETVAHQVIPAQYGTVAQTQLVAPASERWVPVAQGHGHRRHHGHHGHHAYRGHHPVSARH